MSEDSEKKYENGLQHHATRNYDAFTWRIPSVSSIPHQVDYVVQSPPFTFDGASFILKMYPYGQTERGSEGYIDLILERLHSQTDKQNIFIQMFCRDVIDKKIRTVNKNFHFTSGISMQFRALNFIKSLKDSPEKWRIAPNDTFTLICALGKVSSDLNKEDFQTKLTKENVGVRFTTSRNYGNREVGEIFKEYSDFKQFSFKICRIALVPASYQIREQFTFANAVWILKIYPHFRVVNSNKPSFDMVLERLQAEIPAHHVYFEIAMADPRTHVNIIEKSFLFDAHLTQGEVIPFQITGEDYQEKCLHFDMNLRSKKITGVESVFNSESTEQVIAGGSSTVLQNSKVLQDYKKLFLQHEDSDVTIKVKDQQFPAHRLILKSRSPVLASAFRYDMKEKSTGILNIEDCEPSIFSQFLYFLYCGELESLSEENAYELFTVADKYDASDLRTLCMEFMKENLSVDTFGDIIALALRHSEAELIKLCTDFFARNLQEIIVTVKWQSFITENPIQGNELMIKALVTNNPLRSRDPDRQTQRERQTHGVKNSQKRTQQDRPIEKDAEDRDMQREKNNSLEQKSSTEENYENKFCSLA